MTKLRDRRITQSTADGLSVEEKDAVFWDRDITRFVKNDFILLI